jgi:hypothetical protein
VLLQQDRTSKGRLINAKELPQQCSECKAKDKHGHAWSLIYLKYPSVRRRPVEVIFTARRIYPTTSTRGPSEGDLDIRSLVSCCELMRGTMTFTKTYKTGFTALTVSLILLNWYPKTQTESDDRSYHRTKTCSYETVGTGRRSAPYQAGGHFSGRRVSAIFVAVKSGPTQS